MTQIRYAYDTDSVTFAAEARPPGWFARMSGGVASDGDVDGWAAGDAARCDALAALRARGDDRPGTVRFDESRIVASHGAVAALDSGQAHALGLPGRPPYAFAADTKGVIGSPGFELEAKWLDSGLPVATRRCGAFLETAQGEFLIPEPLFSAIEIADGFDARAMELPDHWAVLARFRRLLEPEADSRSPTQMAAFLEGLRIYTGAALSLALSRREDGVDFDPVLFDAETARKAEEEGRPLTEKDGMLSGDLLDRFQKHPQTGFRAFDSAKRTYLLDRNRYLIVDDDLETALQTVREAQRSGAAKRRAFAANPRAAIAERLARKARESDEKPGSAEPGSADEEVQARANTVFVETPEYADRAIGVGVWEAPFLPFLPLVPNVWLPEIFALDLGGVWVRLDSDSALTLRKAVDEAMAKSQPHVEHRGQTIPATLEVRERLAEAITDEKPNSPGDGETGPDDGGDWRDTGKTAPPDGSPVVILVHENFVEEDWAPANEPRKGFADAAPPSSVKSSLFDHQRRALEWQIEAWQEGYPGVLNADDQGLGKTLQTLAFLAWLQTDMEMGPPEGRAPLLIVAPTGLLRTWQAESETHLTETGLGARIDAHGTALDKQRGDLPGKDTDDGKPRLKFEELRTAIQNDNGHKWQILTTYETLANYQHSFRQIEFSAVVFDEIQKIKNARTLISLAARSVRAGFRIGLTGTPIENHVSDLWAIMDAVAPGRLGTLKHYLERYRTVTEERMKELHTRLFKPLKKGERRLPPIAQRRFKEGEIASLPRKDYRLYPATMPGVQAGAYETARRHLADGARGAAFKLLHHIRGISLHPQPPDTITESVDDYLARSARFEPARRILERIRDRRERALIFMEDRRMLAFAAQWLRSEFGLRDVRIINGETPISRRKKYVDEFQKHLSDDGGFDIMLLSPRAAGVGLTLTAATHVIHLSRWWNPAVEEQCNDRIYRIGQKRDVTVHIPLAIHPAYRENSFDCVLNELMRRKMSLARAALWPQTDSDFDHGMLVTGVAGAEPLDPAEIDRLDWGRFEDWVMRRARDSGDWEVSRTSRSGDAGADAVLRHRRRRDASALVQAKHTTDRQRAIDAQAIREVLRAAGRYDVRNPQLVVVTNARDFTGGARKLALENDVRLVDRDRLGLWPSHVIG